MPPVFRRISRKKKCNVHGGSVFTLQVKLYGYDHIILFINIYYTQTALQFILAEIFILEKR